jgi:DinB superfamily
VGDIAALSLNPAALTELLRGEMEFADPARILAGLRGEQACARVPGAPHSIAELVSHMLLWQERRTAFGRGENPPWAEVEAGDWRGVEPGEWLELRRRFINGFDALAECARDEGLLSTDLSHGRNFGLSLASQTLHNAHHLGQIILLRQLLGLWPPAGE